MQTKTFENVEALLEQVPFRVVVIEKYEDL
jgi:hypothetical protein